MPSRRARLLSDHRRRGKRCSHLCRVDMAGIWRTQVGPAACFRRCNCNFRRFRFSRNASPSRSCRLVFLAIPSGVIPGLCGAVGGEFFFDIETVLRPCLAVCPVACSAAIQRWQPVFDVERQTPEDAAEQHLQNVSRGSSVVERVIGNDEVGSSILPHGTIPPFKIEEPSTPGSPLAALRHVVTAGR